METPLFWLDQIDSFLLRGMISLSLSHESQLSVELAHQVLSWHIYLTVLRVCHPLHASIRVSSSLLRLYDIISMPPDREIPFICLLEIRFILQPSAGGRLIRIKHVNQRLTAVLTVKPAIINPSFQVGGFSLQLGHS